MPDVYLTVNGLRYGGWKEVEVRRSIEQISGSFALSLTSRWEEKTAPWPIDRGDECTLAIDADVLITGYVDEVIPFFDAKGHGISVIGRDKTGDLVDCSAIAKSGQWQGRTLLQIATDLTAPFGINVRADVDYGEAFRESSLQEGETVFEALDRAARMRGVLLVSDGVGGLLITRAGTRLIETALVQGENILAGRASFSLRDRYDQYFCKGQTTGFDDSTPEQNANPKGQATDPNVRRYRPLIIIAEDIADSKGFDDRALWEAAVRMGRSARPQVTVQGWRHSSGLWTPNELAVVDCPSLRLDSEMLIVSTTFTLNADGSRTDLELCRPEGFDLLAVPETSEWGGAW